MIKKLVYTLLLFLFTSCLFKVDDCHDLSLNKLPLIHQGDTLIYTNSKNKKDTFCVTTLSSSHYTTGLSRTCYQDLICVIDKVNNSNPDTAGFNQIHIYVSKESGLSLWFQRTGGTEGTGFTINNPDSLYKQTIIDSRIYNSVNYYSSISKTHCKDLYFSFQYGVLSVKINNNLIYLSEMKPAR